MVRTKCKKSPQQWWEKVFSEEIRDKSNAYHSACRSSGFEPRTQHQNLWRRQSRMEYWQGIPA